MNCLTGFVNAPTYQPDVFGIRDVCQKAINELLKEIIKMCENKPSLFERSFGKQLEVYINNIEGLFNSKLIIMNFGKYEWNDEWITVKYLCSIYYSAPLATEKKIIKGLNVTKIYETYCGTIEILIECVTFNFFSKPVYRTYYTVYCTLEQKKLLDDIITQRLLLSGDVETNPAPPIVTGKQVLKRN